MLNDLFIAVCGDYKYKWYSETIYYKEEYQYECLELVTSINRYAKDLLRQGVVKTVDDINILSAYIVFEVNSIVGETDVNYKNLNSIAIEILKNLGFVIDKSN